ncbi:polyprenyl synthetase family protein [Flavicella sp.]|uniref:polyprenyl synthetase family protein n=1 Tax=Flavicella sp. TaxID=2957742 RepID=UPI00261729B3|nr:polyprenyl synthetase family protein [Flavicella sp.]MDG1805324.1 polyprenyl synthetase family protein [Flavicella sp.]MDG2280442.1 polyprenyl synthetase family protein [Flavicella sp.]
MLKLEQYKEDFLAHLQKKINVVEPQNLYNPIEYILDLGGKRLRPILVLMGTTAFGGDYKNGLDAALAVEVFHNFTLLHDDIMDDAPLRRGEATVHEKWDVNTAILSGDAMLILANQLLESYDGATFKKLMQLFNKTALEVCEGQQYDMDFETRNDVTAEEYIKMIGLKTSVLVAAALEMGAIIAGASEEDSKKIYEFGLNLGIAFQLQDDYLDAYGDAATFGKQVGGDIMENKKTFLYIEALKNATPELKEELLHWYDQILEDNTEKVVRVKELFQLIGSDTMTRAAIENYTKKAFDVLDEISISEANSLVLKQFGQNLMTRTV